MLLALLFISATVAFGISVVAGGGAGLVVMPILALLLPAPQVPAALSLGTATSSLSRIAIFWRAIRWDVVRWFVPAALPGVGLGVWLLSRFDPIYIKLILGLFLTANLPLLFLRPAAMPDAPTGALSRSVLTAIGASAGLMSGFTGALGLAFNRFYFRLGMTKTEIVATRAANEIVLHAVKIALYAGLGLLTGRSLLAGLVVAAAAVLASVGMKAVLVTQD